MTRRFLFIPLLLLPVISFSQVRSFNELLSDSSMGNASVSFCLIDSDSGRTVFEYNPEKSLIPASVMKLITTAAALELLGPDYTFKTVVGYTGELNKRSGRLFGDIIIKGGGDPALGSKNFEEHYAGFADNWIAKIMNLGIKKINGRVITDDSYFDYQPVPAKWLWEDAGNYYGAGAYGLSVFDNTYEVHFKTSSDSLIQIITGISPEECRFEFSNRLVAAGTADEGYVFAAPYSTSGWLAGYIPANLDDYVLKASIADPPLIMARVIDQKLRAAGITISGYPTTTRLLQSDIASEFYPVTEIISPPLKDIIEILNHKSVNLYAEHLIKELGKVFKNKGSTQAGVEVIHEFLRKSGLNTNGMFIEDGSGLSPLDALNAGNLVRLLSYMQKNGKYYSEYYSSLPEPGKEGTLKNYFLDPVFDSLLVAKSGSMTRVKSYAGYLTTLSGKKMIFSIIVNNFNGPARNIILHIEEIIRETIMSR